MPRILLCEDVDHVGHKGEIVEVKAGYAFNFLLPKKLALLADAAALRRQAKLQEERRLKAAADRARSEEIADKLKGGTLTTEVKVDHEGHMYGSVSAIDIVNLIKEQTGIEIEKRMVLLKHAIKQLGIFDLQLRLKEGVEVLMHINIMSERPVHE